jgi:hypothetical protein
VGDDGDGDSFGSCSAGGEDGEGAGAVDELVVADGGEESDAAFEGLQAGGDGGGLDVGGQVDEVVAVAADGSGGDDGDAAGAQHVPAGGHDLGESAEEAFPSGVGKVAATRPAVAVVGFSEPVVGVGLDQAVSAGSVGGEVRTSAICPATGADRVGGWRRR